MFLKWGHKVKECYSLRSFATAALKVVPVKPDCNDRKNKKDDKPDEGADDF